MTYSVPGDVDVESFALVHAHFNLISRCWEERAVVVAMQGHIQHAGVLDKHVLCAVTMVNIPVYDQHSKDKVGKSMMVSFKI